MDTTANTLAVYRKEVKYLISLLDSVMRKGVSCVGHRMCRSKSPETGKVLRCVPCAMQGKGRFNSEQRWNYSQVSAIILLDRVWFGSMLILRCLRQRSLPHYNESAKEEATMFQDNLKALRKEKGITQEELAARLNVVRQTVSKWEKGVFQT